MTKASLPPGAGTWRFALAGLCAALVGIGIGRFAYTPLIPALIAAHWFAPSDVLYLGAANLAGYLAGALAARPASAFVRPTILVRGAMVAATAACFACSLPLSLGWYFAWRLVAGISGAVVMVLAASLILPQTPPSRRGLVGGVIFTGVGLGIAASGTLVPLLLRSGLVAAWYGLGTLSAVLTLASWWSWPRGPAPMVAALPAHHRHGRSGLAVNALIVEYGLLAVALVPHMVFLVDFVARGLGDGLDAGSRYWVLYGLGAVAGPLLTGNLADRVGFGMALRLAYVVGGAAILLPVATASPAALIVSSLLVGAITPGLVPLTLGRLHDLIAHDADARHIAWSRATTNFALFQALSAYGLSFLFARSGSYLLLFTIGGAAIALCLVINLVMAAVTARRTPPRSDRA